MTTSQAARPSTNGIWGNAAPRRIGALAVALILAGCVATSASAESLHESMVNFRSGTQVETDLFLKYGKTGEGLDYNAPTSAGFTWAGEPGSGQIVYTVGWFTPNPQGGPIELTSSDITSPEYMIACFPNDGPITNQECPYFSPAPMLPWELDASSGRVSFGATGFAGGVFHVAVRDKEKGENPYKGNGFWHTWSSTNIGGKTYLVSKMLDAVLIVRHPTEQDVSLTCEFADGKTGPTKIVFEFDDKVVLINGPDGKVAGVYGIDPNSDVLGWKGWPGKLSTVLNGGVTLDRTTGDLRITYPPQLSAPPIAGHCAKRSTTRVF